MGGGVDFECCQGDVGWLGGAEGGVLIFIFFIFFIVFLRFCSAGAVFHKVF